MPRQMVLDYCQGKQDGRSLRQSYSTVEEVDVKEGVVLAEERRLLLAVFASEINLLVCFSC